MMASLTSDVDYLFSTPTSVEIIGVDVDADRIISTIAPIDGDQSKIKKFMILAGYNRSIFEHLDLEIPLDTPAISGIKAIQIASEKGIPIHKIDTTNINLILPKLKVSQEVIQNIKNAVNAGKEVRVPEQEITYNGWTGTGYIITDPVTGEGAYLISGGKDGAAVLVSVGKCAQFLEEHIENSALVVEGELSKYIDKNGRAVADPPILASLGGRQFYTAVGATFQLGYNPITLRQPTPREFKEEIGKPQHKILYFVGHSRYEYLLLKIVGEGLDYIAFQATRDKVKETIVNSQFKFVFLSGCYTNTWNSIFKPNSVSFLGYEGEPEIWATIYFEIAFWVYAVGWKIRDYGESTVGNSVEFGKWYMEYRLKETTIPKASPVCSGDCTIKLKRTTNP